MRSVGVCRSGWDGSGRKTIESNWTARMSEYPLTMMLGLPTTGDRGATSVPGPRFTGDLNSRASPSPQAVTSCFFESSEFCGDDASS